MRVNGRPVSPPAGAETAIEVIRGQLGLTGTKFVCGTGVCGACTIAVDGVCVTSCLLPAEDLADADVTTIEGVAEDGSLHPVQAAFLAHDALQCGYCTPGFVVEAVTFFDRWRAARGTERPDRDEIARVLAGHLCRCGAYDGIYRAVADACAGQFDGVTAVAGARPDGTDKVTGAARYTTDEVPEALIGRIVRSTVAHGELVSVDLTPALNMPGVRAAIRLAEPGEVIRYHGQALAAVAADDRPTAYRAAQAVVVVIEPRAAAIGAAQCLHEDAPDVHGWWIPPSHNEAPALPGLRRKNLVGPTVPGSLNPWRVRRRLARAEDDGRHLHDHWHTAVQSHTAFEPHAAVAAWETDSERLVIHLSTQAVWPSRAQIARELGLDEEQVEVRATHVGGAFGAKQSAGLEPVAAALLARAARGPVRLQLDRREELTVGGNRPGTEVEIELAYSESGHMEALQVRSVTDSGAAAGALTASFLPRFVYLGAPRILVDYDAVSNTPPGVAARAPGGPPALFALEGAVDEVAHRLGMDPVALRRTWGAPPLREAVYDWVDRHPVWRSRRPGKGRIRRGVGVAFGSWFQAHDPTIDVTVEAGADGVRVITSAQDIGTGTRGMLATAAAEAFGIQPESVEVELGSSAYGRGTVSSGSRTTSSFWPAARHAAGRARRQLLAQLEARGLTGAEAVPGGVVHADEKLSWDELFSSLEPVSVTERRPADSRPLTPFGHRIGGVRFGRGLTEVGHVAEVEVDVRFGTVRVVRLDTVLAAGRIHSSQLARSQVLGGVVQGIGMALHERRRIDPNTGAVLTTNLEDYHLPGIGDVPAAEVDFIEWGFEHVPGSGVGLAELAIVAVPAAVANAVRFATGRGPRRLPIMPSDVMGEP